MLLRFDPFRELDRVTESAPGRTSMPMDAVRRGETVLVSERPAGPISRQLLLGDSLDGPGVVADYDRGVLTLYIPVAAAAKPRKIEIGHGRGNEAIDAEAVGQN